MEIIKQKSIEILNIQIIKQIIGNGNKMSNYYIYEICQQQQQVENCWLNRTL